MSAITIGGDLVHYEVLGRGRPVILVHGWIGSWRYWVPAMQQLLLKYRVYALDLYGFGDTSKNQKKYTLDQQVQLLTDFMHQLAIPKAALMGHSLGALVVAEFARRHQEERVPRLVLVSPPLFDPGDLQERVPAGHRVMLTGTKPLPPLPTTPAQAATTTPATTTPATSAAAPATSTAPAAVPAASATPATATPGAASDNKQPDSLQPHESTIPSASTAMRAALMEAARVRTHADSAPAAAKPGDAAKPAQPPPAAGTPVQPPVSTNQAHPVPPPNPPELKDTSMLRSDPVKKPEHNPLHEHVVAVGLEKLLAKCFKTSQPEYEKLRVDLGKTDSEALKQSVEGFDSGRVLDTLRLLKMPTVIIHGADDPVIPQPSEGVWNYITVDKEDTLLPIPLPGVRHFPMLEHERFLQLITDFLESPDVSKLEIKERWKRRTR